jgi:acetylornithine/N-succinyldiaminopimelate aminotransferase
MLTHRQLFLNHIAQTSPAPLLLEFERAEGMYMYDTEGKQYLDLISGISVNNIGHRHPKVISAIKEQLDKYMHLMVYGEFVQSPQVKFAELLTYNLPSSLNSVYFTNSGSEAIEGALKLAKRFTGRTEIIACKNAYHGSTQGALSIMGNEDFKSAFRPLLPDVRFITFNKIEDIKLISDKTACVVVETIQGEAGAIVPEDDYLQKLQARCNETGTLLVIDEIQSGFGRTGKLFAFEHYNVKPDILTIAKGMGGGMPIGAFISSQEIMNSLSNNPVLGHITTFGGHPVCCAAGLAALQVLFEEELIQSVPQKEMLFRKLLVHPKIKAIRGKGLLLAVEFESAELNHRVIDLCIQKQVFTDWFLFADPCMRIAPPLIISDEEIKKACEVILGSLGN